MTPGQRGGYVDPAALDTLIEKTDPHDIPPDLAEKRSPAFRPAETIPERLSEWGTTS